MWAHVHVLEMRERAGAQRRQVPAVPGADRGGGPGIRGAVNYTTTVRSFWRGRLRRETGEEKKEARPLLLHLTGFTLHTYISAARRRTAAMGGACVRCVVLLIGERVYHG